jgi:hypothetical protein
VKRTGSTAKVVHTVSAMKEETVVTMQIYVAMKILFRNWPAWQTFLKKTK